MVKYVRERHFGDAYSGKMGEGDNGRFREGAQYCDACCECLQTGIQRYQATRVGEKNAVT